MMDTVQETDTSNSVPSSKTFKDEYAYLSPLQKNVSAQFTKRCKEIHKRKT
jgi:hypothetical protein